VKPASKGDNAVTLLAVGDVMVARKDWKSSFSKVESILKAGDISFFNCETPYATTGCPGLTGAVPHDPRGMPALAAAGLNVCTLANNHTLDWGVDAVVECRERLEALNIAVCGAGRDINEARKPAILERKGVKVAFLGYSSAAPNGSMAEERKPGSAMVRVRTMYEPYDWQPGTPATKVLTWAYKEDLEAMVDDIKRAKAQADIVVMTDHWGIHNVPVMIPDYEYEVGHAAIDAGADLVLGTHPHILKGIEVYKGKVIVHSLANFVMESKFARAEGEQRVMLGNSYGQMMKKIYDLGNPDKQKSIILKCIITGGEIQRVSYVPVMLEKTTDPEPMPHSDPRAQEIFEYMTDITRDAGLSTRYSWDGDEVLVAV